MGAEPVNTQPDLRRLEFVKSYSESIFGSTFKLADSIYRTTRAHAPLPGFVDVRVKQAENKFSEFSVPALNFVQDRATQLLTVVDCKVRSCALLTVAGRRAEGSRFDLMCVVMALVAYAIALRVLCTGAKVVL